MNYVERGQRRTRQRMAKDLKVFMMDVLEFVVEETIEVLACVGLFASMFLFVPFLMRAFG